MHCRHLLKVLGYICFIEGAARNDLFAYIGTVYLITNVKLASVDR